MHGQPVEGQVVASQFDSCPDLWPRQNIFSFVDPFSGGGRAWVFWNIFSTA